LPFVVASAMGHWRPRGRRRPLRNKRQGVSQADAGASVRLAGVVTPQKRNKAARNWDNWQKKRAGNVSDDDEKPALLGVEHAQRSAKKAETKGRAPLAKKAGRTAVGAGAEAKAIKEINSEEWTTKGHRPGRAPIALGRRQKGQGPRGGR
jgi:hypothetical protein